MHNFHFPPAPSSSPWYPTWHPGGDRVAVAMSGSLWEVDIASGDAFEIVHGPDYYSSPNYSPDGTWLVYHRGRRRRHDRPRGHEHGHRPAPTPHRRRAHSHRPPLLPVRQPHRLRLDGTERILQRLHPPLRRRRLGRGRNRGHLRPLLRPRPALLRPLGHAHLTGLAAERRGVAPRVQPRRGARQRQRVPGSGAGRRNRGTAGRPRGADSLPHPAARLVRRQALRLLLDRRLGRPVPEPVCAAHHRRRTVQDDLLRLRRLPPALVTRCGVDRVRGERRRTAAAPSAGSQRRGAPPDRHRRAALGAADGHAVADHGRRRRQPRRQPHPPHRLRRQGLRARRRLRPREPRRRPDLPSPGFVQRGTPGRDGPNHHCARLRDATLHLRAADRGGEGQHDNGPGSPRSPTSPTKAGSPARPTST